MRFERLAMICLLVSPTFFHAENIRTGEDVLRAMHDRYQSSWYQTVTFVQKSTTYKPDGTTSVETWYEAASVPGKLRIDIGPASDGKGYLMIDGNLTILNDNKIDQDRSLREHAPGARFRCEPPGPGNHDQSSQRRGIRSHQDARRHVGRKTSLRGWRRERRLKD